jgi:nitroimidazol reductase NimA-like FMN-containing flavoprotein (pyridoxamine 5'-phosphate oxidase superfamily)
MSEPAKAPIDNYEDVTVYGLDDADEQALLSAHNECTFIWSNKEGWPVGVIMSYVYRNGKFWLTASGQRARVSAVRRDPRVCVVVTSTGSPLPKNKTVTWKGTCTVHDAVSEENTELKTWFYNELAFALRPEPKAAALFAKFLDSPRRVIFEVDPTQRIGYDGAKMAKATAEWISAQNA